MDVVADRKRKRTIIGYTEIPCPHCGGGPLVLTSSRFTRRLRDVVKPGFDAKIVYRETCSACRMRFSVSTETQPATTRAAAMSGAPAPLFAEPATGASKGPKGVEQSAEKPVPPVTPIRSTKPTQAAFFTDDDELDED